MLEKFKSKVGTGQIDRWYPHKIEPTKVGMCGRERVDLNMIQHLGINKYLFCLPEIFLFTKA